MLKLIHKQNVSAYIYEYTFLEEIVQALKLRILWIKYKSFVNIGKISKKLKNSKEFHLTNSANHCNIKM